MVKLHHQPDMVPSNPPPQELEKLRPMAAATAEVEQRATSAEERDGRVWDVPPIDGRK